MTKELEKRFKEVGDQSEKENPLVIAKFFSPVGGATWFASEYDPQTNICYGYVKDLVPSPNGIYDEFGYFSITELESVTLPFGLKIERDIHFDEITFDELIKPKIHKRESELKDIKENKDQKQDLER
ncbi:DUF2958 domain-containing protein [Polaribacter pectinis]|uniref:DUF2958 domain-containing protein n=1 Tax=Polaribacter pectinis TaxID=2738844 RepID=A0A7G9L8E2_9FLAO|nr:DUF2958 domain-containing protein [Polaribacter pectinis]QNM84891.1 DUF2958 domain-containing protein [Polaribacter pectinis]